MKKNIHGVEVIGSDVDEQTRCAHYHSGQDIIAIKFHCCREWYPCHSCHAEFASHPANVWPAAEFDTRAILCGACGYQLTIREYLACRSVCPNCHRDFNPRCASHRHLYFGSCSEVRPLMDG